MIISYTVPEIWHVTDVILFFIFGYLLPFYPLPSYQPKKIKIQKKKKIEKPWRYHHFTHVSKKISSDVQFLRYGARQADRGTDRWMVRWTDKQTNGWMDGQKK